MSEKDIEYTIQAGSKISTLLSLAKAEGCKLRIKLVPKKGKKRKVRVLSGEDFPEIPGDPNKVRKGDKRWAKPTEI
jgi:hypothetical protein